MRKKSWGENKTSFLDKIIQRLRYNIVLKNLRLYKRSSTLDLGCGYNATFLYSLVDQIEKGVGVDLSVKKSLNQKIRLLRRRVDQKLPFANNTFNIIVSLAVIEHVEHPDIMLSECYRLLKKGGNLIITTPSKMNKPLLEFLAFKLKIINEQEIRDHKRYYDKQSLKQSLIKAGFKKNKIAVKYFQLGLNIFSKAIK